MKRAWLFCVSIIWVMAICSVAMAQTTTFNYQGRLTEAGDPANGSFQMQFKLFDSVAGGTQIGSTINDVAVTVSLGNFSAKLDFGASALSGANRWLEIAVRHNSGESYVTLTPREQIASSPYAVRTLSASVADNALQLGGVAASEYVTTTNGGSSFIRNGLTQQPGSFNISGGGNIGTELGIGTTDPLQMLHLRSPAGTNAAALVEAPAGFFAQYQLKSGATTPWIIGTQDSFAGNGLLFRNGAVDLMSIQPGGNVGIGTAFPSQRLHVNSSVGNAGALVQTPAGAFAQYHLRSGVANPWIIGTQDSFAGGSMLFRNGATDLMAILPGGNVGIGMTSPQSKLSVLSSGHGITQTDGTVTVGTYTDSTGGWLGTRSTHSLHFFTGNGLQQMTLSTSGNLGIGTINPIFGRVHVRATDIDGVYSSSNLNGIKGDTDGDGRAGLRGDGSGSGGFGVYGIATGGGNSTGVYGESTSSVGYGVFAKAPARGVWGKTTSNGSGIYGDNGGSNDVGYAGFFNGRVHVGGFLSKAAGSFKIDHPLDPERKYLLHSFVESPDMMNIYNGNVTTDANGYATVTMPEWFEALNQDFRYQLTVIGQFAQAIVARKLENNRFTIQTDKPGVEVSWQVTGIRHDAYARANRIPVEQDKSKDEMGRYLHPRAFGQPEEKGIERALEPVSAPKMNEPSKPKP